MKIKCGKLKKVYKKKIDVSNYANSAFSYKQMKIMRESLEKGLNVNSLKDPKLTVREMEALSTLLESKVSLKNNK